MCVKNGLQNTDIIKDKYYPHSFAWFIAVEKSATGTVSSWYHWQAPVAQLDRATDF